MACASDACWISPDAIRLFDRPILNSEESELVIFLPEGVRRNTTSDHSVSVQHLKRLVMWPP